MGAAADAASSSSAAAASSTVSSSAIAAPAAYAVFQASIRRLGEWAGATRRGRRRRAGTGITSPPCPSMHSPFPRGPTALCGRARTARAASRRATARRRAAASRAAARRAAARRRAAPPLGGRAVGVSGDY